MINITCISQIFLKQRFSLLAAPRQKKKFAGRFLFFSLSVGVFLLSYMFLIQPASLPESSEIEDCYEDDDTANDSFILHYPDGSYILIENCVETIRLSQEQIKQAPYNMMEIVDIVEVEQNE